MSDFNTNTTCPIIAGNVRFSRKQTFPTGPLMSGLQQKLTSLLVLSGATEDVQHLLASDTGNGYFDLLSDLVVRLVRLSPDDAQ